MSKIFKYIRRLIASLNDFIFSSKRVSYSNYYKEKSVDKRIASIFETIFTLAILIVAIILLIIIGPEL